ncbi:MAG: hypothetical protein M3421_13230 [Bacteroidota bacterium]|nr:hypothetical protein [Bacteroidota bacterium]
MVKVNIWVGREGLLCWFMVVTFSCCLLEPYKIGSEKFAPGIERKARSRGWMAGSMRGLAVIARPLGAPNPKS